MIGSLEELTLLAALRAGESALPIDIYDRLKPVGAALPAFGAVYTTLGRLAAKGFLQEGKTVDGQGRTRRTFTIAGAGRQALAENANARSAVVGGDFVGAFNG